MWGTGVGCKLQVCGGIRIYYWFGAAGVGCALQMWEGKDILCGSPGVCGVRGGGGGGWCRAQTYRAGTGMGSQQVPRATEVINFSPPS